MAIDMNTNSYYQQPQANSNNEHPMTIDAKLRQAQSQFGAVGAAAVAVAAHREVGSVHLGLLS